MKVTTGRRSLVLSVFAVALLAACGGGGDEPGTAVRAAEKPAASVTGPLSVPGRTVVEAAASGRSAGPKAEAGRSAARVPGSKLYIVQLADDPVLAYRGGVPGYAATKPSQGSKVDPANHGIASYKGLLTSKHDAALAAVGASGRKAYSYTYTFNGFAADLSESQAVRLALQPGVVAVSKDEARKLDTATTPAFLGLSGPTGFWSRTGATGEDVVVGVVDGGIWPEHPSFSDRTPAGKRAYRNLPGWHGKCEKGEEFKASDCNQKLIGARYYNAAWGGNAGIDAYLPWEFNSPRDFGGHGSHTASTAAGNADVPITGPGAGLGRISGIAPRARIAVYKTCWETGAGGACFTSDSVAAIEQAIEDGVDVINYSVSGSRTNFLDPVEVAFLNAAESGIFVATSAGNEGPATSTVAHPSPWVTTVAAGTHNRDGTGSVTLGNGATYVGASLATAVASRPLIDSIAAGLPGADPTALALCFAAVDNGGVAVLDPAKVAGKIVLCDRGVNARVNKSLAVQEAGGVGMVLVNTSANSINADLHAVPTVHLHHTDRPALKAYAATAGATAQIAQSTVIANGPAPFTAAFSSRGPLLAAGGDLLKPDLIAPGQDIIAAVAPPFNFGRLFDSYSGTSMSSPHVAGLAALMKELYPRWSPMRIKSALMTTAGDVLDGPNTHPLVIFRQGAGHVRPAAMDDPGLVFDSNLIDWVAFLCGTGQHTASYCRFIRIDPSDLNVASIAIGDLAGTQTVTRRVTNVGRSGATYTAAVAGMAGIDTVVSPASLHVPAGQTRFFQVRFTRTTAEANADVGGQLTLSDGTHNVRVPMVVRPVAMSVPAAISAPPGGASYSVRFGYSGPFSASARGLVPAAVTHGTTLDDPSDGSCSLASTTAAPIAVTLPAGTSHARFSLFDTDVTAGSDIDLCVFRGTTMVGTSGSSTSAEEVNLVNPPAGDYTVIVHGFAVAGSSPFKLHTWLLGTTPAGNMSVAGPSTATSGASATITLGFSGLAAATRYLGSVAYAGSTGMPDPTIVRVDTP